MIDSAMEPTMVSEAQISRPLISDHLTARRGPIVEACHQSVTFSVFNRPYLEKQRVPLPEQRQQFVGNVLSLSFRCGTKFQTPYKKKTLKIVMSFNCKVTNVWVRLKCRRRRGWTCVRFARTLAKVSSASCTPVNLGSDRCSLTETIAILLRILVSSLEMAQDFFKQHRFRRTLHLTETSERLEPPRFFQM